MKAKQEKKLEETKVESIQKETWQTPKVEILPIPDLTKGGAGADWMEGGSYNLTS